MRNITTNFLAVANFLFSRRASHIERILTRALIDSPVEPKLKTLVRQAALVVVEAGASFLVTGNQVMGNLAINRLDMIQRIAPQIAQIADALATLFAAAYQIDRRQGIVSYKWLKTAVNASSLGYAKAICSLICPSKPARRVVRWAA